MKVQKFTFNPFQENTYVLYDDTKECVIIDPGCYESAEQDTLKKFISEKELKPVALLNTHCHIDHVLGNYFVAKEYDIDLSIHELDLVTLQSIASYAEAYGFGGYALSPEPKHYFKDGDKITFGNSELDVIFTPGHAPGHVVFHSPKHKFVINGDVLFEGSFGRVDLPGGDFETLKKSIISKMFVLPEDTLVYTGHGNETTIGREKKSNPITYMSM